MNKELEETVLKVADYSNEEKMKLTRRMHWVFLAGFVSFILFLVIWFMEPEEASFMYGYIEGVTFGIPFAAVLAGAIMTSKRAAEFRAFKRRILRRGMDS